MRGEREMNAADETRENLRGSLDVEPKRTAVLLGSPRRRLVVGVAVGLVVVVTAVTAAAVLLTSGSTRCRPTFSTGADMLDFLLASCEVGGRDGLEATWFHRANSREEMENALASRAMILEADVTVHGLGTPNERPIPVMAHPPDVYSDNTLDQWLDSVLDSRKGIKLDFKALASVGLSLDLLVLKNRTRGIQRPLWINADVLHGPNVPPYLPIVNGTRFLQLIQEKFPDVTVSPGWKVGYSPPHFVDSYTRDMVENMFQLVRDVPQKVTFPVHALLVRSGWHHLSWLLSRSSRFSLTLWQGSTAPNVSDLLFVRENLHPARVYYDIYEPTLSHFKTAAREQGLMRRFYPGGFLMDFVSSWTSSSLDVSWFLVSGRWSLLDRLSGSPGGGMLVLHVSSDGSRPGVPVIEPSGSQSESLTLQDVLEVLGQRPDVPLGVYLQIQNQEVLERSLRLLDSFYWKDQLYRPVWIGLEGPTQSWLSSVETLFPFVTLVLKERPRVPVSQRVVLHLNASSLHLNASSLHLNAPSLHLNASSLHLNAPSLHLNASSLHLNASSLHLNAPSLHLNAPSLHLNAPSSSLLETLDGCDVIVEDARDDVLDVLKDVVERSKSHLFLMTTRDT